MPALDSKWSPAKEFPASTLMRLSMLNGAPACVDGNDFYFLDANNVTWTKRTFLPAVEIPNAWPQFDPLSPRLVLHDGDADFGNVRNGQFHARIVCCSVNRGLGFSKLFDRELAFGTNDFFGTNLAVTCSRTFPPKWKPLFPRQVVLEEGRLGGSLILENEVYVAYSVGCGSRYGPTSVGATGPNQSGLLHGSPDGSRWTKVKLLDIGTIFSDVFATSNHIYFVAAPLRGLEDNLKPGLQSVRIPRAGNAQPVAEIVAPTYSSGVGPPAVVARAEVIHIAWPDQRHERQHPIRSMLTDTPSLEGNWEIYYRSRKDSDSAWTKEILLSKGLDFAFDPQMAVEGDNIVVVFGGYKKDGSRAVARLHPSDIFVTSSRDGGKTWRPPTRVTDNAKAGVCSNRPKVALHNGYIHLFYEAAALMYQRRAFPEE